MHVSRPICNSGTAMSMKESNSLSFVEQSSGSVIVENLGVFMSN